MTERTRSIDRRGALPWGAAFCVAALIWPGLHLGLETFEWHTRNFAGYMQAQRTILDCLTPETLPAPCVESFADTSTWARENMARVARLTLRDGPPYSPLVTHLSAKLYWLSAFILTLSTVAIALDTRRPIRAQRPPNIDNLP